jgi:hypothetical protein
VTNGIGTCPAAGLRIATSPPTERGNDVRKAWIVCPLFMVTLLALVAVAVIRLRRLERQLDALSRNGPERS